MRWRSFIRGTPRGVFGSRGGISDGGAGRAILLEDPSGNVVELFEFKKDRASGPSAFFSSFIATRLYSATKKQSTRMEFTIAAR